MQRGCIHTQIFESRKVCEVDPSKLSDGDNLESNLVSYYYRHSCSVFITYFRPTYYFTSTGFSVLSLHQVFLALA